MRFVYLREGFCPYATRNGGVPSHARGDVLERLCLEKIYFMFHCRCLDYTRKSVVGEMKYDPDPSLYMVSWCKEEGIS